MIGVRGNVTHIVGRYVYYKVLGLQLPREENPLLSLDRVHPFIVGVQDGHLNICRGG